MSYKIVIPARFASSRLPGKPLVELAGKPMIQHVYERAVATGVQDIVIATDDQRIQQAAEAFGAEVVMTSPKHENGTERIAEVAQIKGWGSDEVIVNLQGDEPLIPQSLVELTAQGLINHPEAGMSSICTPIQEDVDAFNPNVVKVVLNKDNFALYFSRAPIPWDREQYTHDKTQKTNKMPVYRHIGMYGYRVSFLQQYAQMEPCVLETTESLEQLRALWYGVKIHMGIIEQAPAHGVDTLADAKRVEQLLLKM